MRYMMLVKHPRDYDPGQVAPALFGAMGEFVGGQIKNGMFIVGAGLQPLTKATRVKLARGRSPSPRPFSEAKEAVGGYALIEAKSHADASRSPPGSWSFTVPTGRGSRASPRCGPWRQASSRTRDCVSLPRTEGTSCASSDSVSVTD